MSVARNTALNLAGYAVPLLATVVSMPIYIALIGVERFGILSTCWVLLGFSSLFDFGLGRAVAQQIAIQSKTGTATERSATFWTAHWLNLAIGGSFGLIFLAVGPYLLGLLRTTPDLASELAASVPWLAAAVPVGTIANVLSGALEGRERFDMTNAINAVGLSLITIGPLIAAAAWSTDLPVLIAASVLPRLAMIGCLYLACFRAIPLSGVCGPRAPQIPTLLRFGFWMTLGGLAGPLLEYFNGFAVGAVLNAALIVSFAIPYSVCARIQLLPGALSSALFPRFAASDVEAGHAMQTAAVRVLGTVMTPLILIAILFGKPAFILWLGPQIAENCAPSLFLLLGGFWAHAFIYVPYSRLQAMGRPDVVTKTRLVELIPYWALLIVALQEIGVAGAALVWALRAVAEPIILAWLIRTGVNPLRQMVIPAGLVFASVGAGLLLPRLGLISWLAMALLALAGIAWSIVRAPPEITERMPAFMRRLRPS